MENIRAQLKRYALINFYYYILLLYIMENVVQYIEVRARVVAGFRVIFIEKLRFALFYTRIPFDVVLRFNDAHRSRVIPRRRFFAFLALHRIELFRTCRM